MIIGVSVIITCLIYTIMITSVYFSKKRMQNQENKIYSALLINTVINLILELLCCYFTYYENVSILNTKLCYIFNRMFLIGLLNWLTFFTYYIFFVTFGKKKTKSTIKKILAILYIILLALIFILPLNYHNDGTYVYSYGPASKLLEIYAAFTIFFDVYCVLRNHTDIKNKQYYPLYALIILMTIALIIRNINPGIILINSTLAFLPSLMFHTIENPDVQMISELYKNKQIIEKSNEDTSRFIFRITQDIKNPIKQLIDSTEQIEKTKNIQEIKKQIKYINNYATQLDYQVNKTLNISNLDTQRIKIYKNRYNVYNLFNEINYRIQKEINGKYEFNYTIDKSIPKYLYGDTIKLKQAVTALLLESVKHTEEGFINLDISSITKYDVCRLMIQIEDSGKGMDIEKINEIMSTDKEDIEQLDIENIEENNISIKAIKKIIKILGGNLLIKSEPTKGTTFNIVLDQKIVKTENSELSKKLENYEQTLKNSKKILVIDDNEKELAQIVDIFKDEIHIDSSVYERDCIENVRAKIKYDLIILDDEMPNYSALTLLKELQKIPYFNTKVVVMINKNKEGIKLEYLKDGFADYILKENLDNEIKRIRKRFNI